MYQAETTIERTLQSLVYQTHRPLEVIIVNDGSTDGSVTCVTAFIQSQNDPAITFYTLHQNNQGASSARNRGLERASGDYIALLDADDEWLPIKLESQLAVFQKYPYIDFLGTTRNGERFHSWFFKKFGPLTSISARLLLYKTFFATPTVLFKRHVLQSVGYFNEQQTHSEDANYWIRVCKDHQCFLLNQSLVITGGGKPHIGYSGLSANIRAMAKGELQNMKLGYQLGVVGWWEYMFLLIYCRIKYFRRLWKYKSR